MSNWTQPGIPHKGWKLVDVYDVREEGQSIEETTYETCMMCNNERIRYVHVVTHDEVKEDFNVGCICAEKMTDDYVNPKLLEEDLKSRSNKRANWTKRKWKTTKNGNYKLGFEGHSLLIFIDKKTGKYKGKIDEQFGKKTFETIAQAKMAILKGIEYYKQKDEWD